MNAILVALRMAGITIRLQDGRLMLSPSSGVSEELASLVRANKPLLVDVLTLHEWLTRESAALDAKPDEARLYRWKSELCRYEALCEGDVMEVAA